jgi:UDP-N-acetylmuramoyl-tripeptide--D-alanyl-D-alanine ligase
MLELGSYEELGHRLVGRRAGDVADLLITVGPRARVIAHEAREAGLAPEAVVELEDSGQALRLLRQVIQPGDVVLLKGSRAVRLDTIVPALEVRP